MDECTCEFDEDVCPVCPEDKCGTCGRRWGHDEGCAALALHTDDTLIHALDVAISDVCAHYGIVSDVDDERLDACIRQAACEALRELREPGWRDRSADEGPQNDDWIQASLERSARASRPQTTSEMMLEDLRLDGPPY